MSQDITLSDAFINNLYTVICQHDEGAQQSMIVALQYLSAVSGYMLGDFPGSEQERDDLIDQLAAFSKSVASDRAAQQQQAQSQPEAPQQPQGKSVATDDPAVGIWKPE